MGTKKLSDYMPEKALTGGSVGHAIGDLKFNECYIPISSTHPWKNLADPDEELDIANYPDYVPVMRDIKMRVPLAGWDGRGIEGKFRISSYSITSNIARINITAVISAPVSYIQTWLLNALAEKLLDYTDGISPTNTDYSNWNMCSTLTNTVGVIPAGNYTITNINPSSNYIEFAYTHADVPTTAVSDYFLSFYPYRVPNDATKCRHRQQLGKSIMTPDFETFFNGVSGRDNEIDNRSNDKGYLGAFAYRYVGRYIP